MVDNLDYGIRRLSKNRGRWSLAAVKMEAEHSRVFESFFPTIDSNYISCGFCIPGKDFRQYDVGNQRADG